MYPDDVIQAQADRYVEGYREGRAQTAAAIVAWFRSPDAVIPLFDTAAWSSWPSEALNYLADRIAAGAYDVSSGKRPHDWIEADEGDSGSFRCARCGYVPGWLARDELDRPDQLAIMPSCPPEPVNGRKM